MSRLIAMAIVIGLVVVVMPVSSAMASLPPESPWAIAWPLSSYQWMLWTWKANMSVTLSVTTHRVMLWLNMTAIKALLGLEANASWNMTLSVNGKPMTFNATRRYNMSFEVMLDLTWEYHGNVTAWWHVQVRYTVPTTSHEETTSHGESPWLKYRWAILASLATIVVGIKAGQDMKEARLKAKWRSLLATKAMDVEKILKAMGDEHEEDMERVFLALEAASLALHEPSDSLSHGETRHEDRPDRDGHGSRSQAMAPLRSHASRRLHRSHLWLRGV